MCLDTQPGVEADICVRPVSEQLNVALFSESQLMHTWVWMLGQVVTGTAGMGYVTHDINSRPQRAILFGSAKHVVRTICIIAAHLKAAADVT